jgi:hypothetical protein
MSDRQLEQEAAVNGPQFVLRLSALIRIARIYDVSNQAFKKQLQNFAEVILEAMEKQSELALVAVADYLYVNGVRIRADASLLSVYHALLGELSSRAIGGIRFHQGVEVAELEKFFQLFVSAEDPQNPERLFQAVADARLEHVELLKTRDVDADEIAHRLEEQMHRTGGRGRPAERGRAGRGWRRPVGRAWPREAHVQPGGDGHAARRPAGDQDRQAGPALRQAADPARRRQHHEERVLDRRPHGSQVPRRVHLRTLRQREHAVGRHGPRHGHAAPDAGGPRRRRTRPRHRQDPRAR